MEGVVTLLPGTPSRHESTVEGIDTSAEPLEAVNAQAVAAEAQGAPGSYSLAAGLSLTSAATLLSIAMSIATNKIIAVHGGPESMALMGLFRNLGVLVTNVISVGFGVLVMQKLATAPNRETVARIIGAGTLLLAMQLGIVVVAAVVLAQPLGAWIFAASPSDGQIIQVRIVLAMAFVNLALQIVTGMLKGQTNFRVIALVPIVTSAASLAMALPLVKMGPVGLAINVGSGSAIGAIVGAVFVSTMYRAGLHIRDARNYWGYLRTMMRPSAYMVLLTGSVAAGLLAAQTIVQKFYGLETLGRYNAAMMVFDTAVMLLMASGRTYLVPILGKVQDESVKARLIGRVILALVAASILVSAVVAVAGGPVLTILFSGEFADGANILFPLCLGLVGISFTYSLNAYLLHKDDVASFVAIDVVWILMIVAGTWVGARSGYGPESAAWAYAIASWIAGGGYIATAQLRHGLRLTQPSVG